MAPITTLLAVGLAALTAAAPTTQPGAPCLSSEFSLSMRYNDAYLTLGAIDSGQDGVLNIVGFDPASYRGTPVAQNGTSGSASLNFDVTSNDDCETTQTGLFGVYVPDLGEVYGAQVPITATKGVSWPHFYVGSGEVDPQLTAASQAWYACNVTVQGIEYVGLSWGVYNSNGSAPWGCEITQVKQKFNIPCGE